MRITFVLPPVNMSGGIRVVAIYAKLLQEMGHDVVLVSPSHRKIPISNRIKSLLRGAGWPATQNIASHLDHSELDHRVLESFRPPVDVDIPEADVVIATWWETAEWVMALSANKGVKVYFVQGHEVFSHVPVARSKATYHLPLHKIVVSKWLQEIMRTEYGDMVVDVVPNSVDHSQFFATARDKQPVPTLGFLYSPINLKGVDITLEVIETLRNYFPNLRVISLGSHRFPYNSYVDANIEFYQSPEQESIRELYARCDVWVTASRSEGFNLMAMEAMACRTPVVSTKTGWPEESIVNGVNGFLADVDDAVSIVESITSVLSLSNEAWRSMSENAFNTVKDSSWDNSAKLFEKSLHRIRHSIKGK